MIPLDRISLAAFSQPIQMPTEDVFALYELEENPEFLALNYADPRAYHDAWVRYAYFQDIHRDIEATHTFKSQPLDGTAGLGLNVDPTLYAIFLNGLPESELGHGEIEIRDTLLQEGFISYHFYNHSYSPGTSYRFLMALFEDPKGLTEMNPKIRPSVVQHEHCHGYWVTDPIYRRAIYSLWETLKPSEKTLIAKALFIAGYCRTPEELSCREVLVNETFTYAADNPWDLINVGFFSSLLSNEEADELHGLLREFREHTQSLLMLLWGE